MSFPDKFENQVQWDFSISNKYRNKFRNAQERGIPFELTLQDFIKLYKRRRCYLTNKVLLFCNEDKDHPRFATLDRIDNTKGYTMANTRLVCSLVCIDLASGNEVTVSAGKLTHDERIEYFNNPPLRQVVKYRSMSYGVKEAPRFARFYSFRAVEDLDNKLVDKYYEILGGVK